MTQRAILKRHRPLLPFGAAAMAIVFVARAAAQGAVGDPPFTIDPATTHITQPLTTAGMPDYVTALLDLQRSGATPENNAAVPFWQAVGATAGHADVFRARSRAIGLEFDPTAPTIEDDSTQQRLLREWAKSRFELLDDPAFDNRDGDEGFNSQVDRLVEAWLVGRPSEAPWRAEDQPALAASLARSKQPLDLLVMASRRTHFFSPPYAILREPTNHPVTALDVANGVAVELRGTFWQLRQRAMLAVGEGRLGDAWSDLIACDRWAGLLGDTPLVTDALAAAGMRASDAKCLRHLIAAPQLSRELAVEIRYYFARQRPQRWLARTLDEGVRLCMLDVAVRVLAEPGDGGPSAAARNIWGVDNLVISPRCDADGTLRRINRYFDQLVAAAERDGFARRQAGLAAAWDETARADELATSKSVNDIPEPIRESSELARMIVDTQPADWNDQLLIAETRDETRRRMMAVAAALSIYRIDHGRYPVQLSDLSPDYLTRIPRDPFTNGTFRYERTGSGYQLYSVGANRRDDDGEYVEEPSSDPLVAQLIAQSPRRDDVYYADDIRMTMPPTVTPWPDPADYSLQAVD